MISCSAASSSNISIHAPSRERQPHGCVHQRSGLYFNPRSLAGATLIGTPFVQDGRFQSTLPRGSDSLGVGSTEGPANFNPRSLAGATQCRLRQLLSIPISIHAPSRERLVSSMLTVVPTQISIHAPSRERREAKNNDAFTKKISIHAPSRERRCYQWYSGRTSRISIHAPSRERL